MFLLSSYGYYIMVSHLSSAPLCKCLEALMRCLFYRCQCLEDSQTTAPSHAQVCRWKWAWNLSFCTAEGREGGGVSWGDLGFVWETSTFNSYSPLTRTHTHTHTCTHTHTHTHTQTRTHMHARTHSADDCNLSWCGCDEFKKLSNPSSKYIFRL